MKIQDWFNQPWEGTPHWNDTTPCETLFERFCFLVARNGGMQVHGWGFISGNRGLSQEQALELLQLGGVYVGFNAAAEGDPGMEQEVEDFDASVQEAINKLMPSEVRDEKS